MFSNSIKFIKHFSFILLNITGNFAKIIVRFKFTLNNICNLILLIHFDQRHFVILFFKFIAFLFYSDEHPL